MCLVFVCDEDERVVARFCFLPLCYKIKRRYYCTMCNMRLEVL
ncbi:uncharacterized protein LOC133295624 [Gastrolobium bilobum]|nr:uncharacterized protein LOC133295624 [Gastrolobium bilobum]